MLDRVFSPLQVGPVTLPNRVVRTAHGTGLARFGVTDEFIAYHTERAIGGCGLSILEAGTVHPSCHLDFPIYSDDFLPGLVRIVDAIRPHGMKLFQQLWHGGNLYPAADGGPPLAVSTRPGATGIVGRPMSIGEIEDIIENGFVSTAVRCQKAGFDGVELHAAHGYIFHQFLSPASNVRTDKYGGDIDGRLRFLLETARAVRAAVGSDFVLGVRVSASRAPNTIDEALAATMVSALCKEGLIDYVNASLGDYYHMDSMIGAMHNAMGYELPSSTQLLAEANVPRLVAGRIRTLEEADQLIRDGTTDLVSMVRAQIADPHLVAKTRSGKSEQVRPCISCNQGCIGGMARVGRMGCAVNPAVGFENEIGERLIQPVNSPLKIMIIGGGPAGMEAARAVTSAGHRAILCEAMPDLGGTVNVARRAPWLHTVGDIIWWQEQELRRLGVEIRLNNYIEADDVMSEKPDIVIVATGSLPRRDGFQPYSPGELAQGIDLPHVVTATELLTGERAPGATALVLDNTGHLEALAVIDYLHAKGVAITYVTHHFQILPYVESTQRVTPLLERLGDGEFTSFLRHQLVEIEPTVCRIRDLYGRKEQRVQAETVVLVTPNEPSRVLYDELLDRHPEVYLIGDAASPRDIQAAITDGYRTACTLIAKQSVAGQSLRLAP